MQIKYILSILKIHPYKPINQAPMNFKFLDWIKYRSYVYWYAYKSNEKTGNCEGGIAVVPIRMDARSTESMLESSFGQVFDVYADDFRDFDDVSPDEAF